MSSKQEQMYEVFIRTTPEKLWKALVDPAMTQKYFFGTLVKTTLKAGEAIVYDYPDNRTAVAGVIISAEPPRKLVHTWTSKYEEKLAKETSTVTWLIEPRGDICKLTVVHELSAAPHTAENVGKEGWSIVLSGLKTFLETGEPMMAAPMG